MILPAASIDYFRMLASKVTQALASSYSETPYLLEGDPVIDRYEALRDVWLDSVAVKHVCLEYHLSRSCYYDMEDRFIGYGLPGLFPLPSNGVAQQPALEQLLLIVRKCRPSVSQTALLRIAQAVPVTQAVADGEIISRILNSHGYGYSSLQTDPDFWARVQRSLAELTGLTEKPVGERARERRRETFFVDTDPLHNRLECLRELFFNPKAKIYETCVRLNISLTTYYRLVQEYRLYGPWAVVPANSYGKSDSISEELQLKIILEKLEHPTWSGQQIAQSNKLRCSRHVVNRIIKRWGLQDKQRPAIALDRFMEVAKSEPQQPFTPIKTARELLANKGD